MIGKVTIGSSFGGVIRYAMEKQDAILLLAEGVRTGEVQAMIQDFNMQRNVSPDLTKAVGHISLSWSKEDAARLSPEIMRQRALEYMEKMKITGTQFILVEHREKNQPHLHIIYNRVDNEGKTITDRFQKERNRKICKKITLRYGYHLGKGKQQVNRQQLKGADKVRYELYDSIKLASANAVSWNELTATLERQGIVTTFKYKSGTSEIQGVSFAKDDLQFKGSKIDRSLSFGKLDALIRQNHKLAMVQQFRKQPGYVPNHPEGRFRAATLSQQIPDDRILDDLLRPVQQYDQQSSNPSKKKKRKKYLGQSL
ncbi:relaxase/mobilization nuclease domain-containing protein [Dyadobacter chenhuakuii]|uniref:Relaxase/mobilization nuclease domain-containing protein n=1 Tax=Dyadobacter chenhuakuii TaxID=2909339 RepID=A0ABY4XJL6_9BACT|nr:relaxase/mobilization nuclease domain-containing protein [Dyadobacter chenhuakuii]MCF2496118.1 relaxase/mobilization nuclease domain-containing protein [Dyadobacter chenhuakuii]USJ30182.1 relaxase/mobilization nuclease domain-containing protein [Dyadobacter chenhuakuii]